MKKLKLNLILAISILFLICVSSGLNATITPADLCKNINFKTEEANKYCLNCNVQKLPLCCQDLDKDGFNASMDGYNCGRVDCDDNPEDDSLDNIPEDFPCPTLEEIDAGKNVIGLNKEQRGAFCYADSNNNGIGDYASCSLCRNPGMIEVADDIDNNCIGRCQGEKNKFDTLCEVKVYDGDGANSNNCSNVPGKLYGETDKFCQMADEYVEDDAGKVCWGYNRIVKWSPGVINKDSEAFIGAVTNPAALNVNLREYELLSFKPGGINVFIVPSFTNLDNFPFEYTLFPGNSEDLGSDAGLKKVEVCYVDKAIGYAFDTEDANAACAQKNKVPVSISLISKYTPQLESKAQTRATADLPAQYIASVWGELDFDQFWKDYQTILQETDVNGNFKWEWKTACVPKDKCNDSVDNDGAEDIRSVAPYSYYFNNIMPDLKKMPDEDGVMQVSNNFFPELILKDVDDSECKFANEQSAGSKEGLPIYSFTDYRLNPITNKPYCKDDDGDGFCGCITKEVIDFGNPANCLKWGTKLSNSGLYEEPICQEYGKRIICDEDATKAQNIGVSNLFPDCDDSFSGDSIQYRFFSDSPNAGKRVLTSPALGWGASLEKLPNGNYVDNLVGKEMSAWNIHPLAPKTRSTCSLGFDVDCNKDMVNNAVVLASGNTPYDVDSSTGKEIMKVNSGSLTTDEICYSVNPDMEALSEISLATGEIVLMGIVAGVPIMVFPFLAVPATILFQVAGTGYGVYEIAACAGQGLVEGLGLDSKNLANADSAFWKCFRGITAVGTTLPPTLVPVFKYRSRMIKIDTTGKFGSKLSLYEKISGKSTKLYRSISKPSTASSKTATSSIKSNPAVPGCFLENTSILLAEGTYKNIEDILVGDIVMAYDINKSAPASAAVSTTFVRNETKYLIIEYKSIEGV